MSEGTGVTEAQGQAGANGAHAGDGGETDLPQPRGGARTWYEVLEVNEDAAPPDIKKAYERALALVEGRSIGGYLMLDPLAAESARADVDAAFAILGDPERRAQYDRARGATTVVTTADAGAASPASARPASELPRAAPSDDESKEARAILELAQEREAAPKLPRAATPLKFASPVDREPTVERPAAGAPAAPPAVAAEKPAEARKAPAIRFEEVEPTEPAMHAHTGAAATVVQPSPYHAPLHTVPPAAPMPAPSPPSTPPAVSSLPPSAAGALPESGPIAGGLIKELRVARGLTVEQLSDATKIRKPYLKAIEEEDIAGLPARVYLRGFLTQVARVLKVDRARLAEGYLLFVESKGGAPKE